MALLAQDLRNSILQAAFQGKLSEQLITDSLVNTTQIDEKKNENIEDIDFNLPDSWKLGTLESITKSISSKAYQIKESEIKEKGLYPVISQSKELKAGFSDDKDKLLNITNPLIFFGDHTTVIKYIDFDCVIGADGVKIFKPSDIVNAWYLYYALTFICIGLENVGGYTRHYKYIKNKPIPIPPIEEQHRIVTKIKELMAKIDEYEKIEKRLEEIKKQFPIDLRDSLLQAAMQGKLTEQLPTDSNVDDLLDKIKEEREKLEKEGKIKKTSSKSALTNSLILDNENCPFEVPSSWRWINADFFNDIVVGATPKTSVEKYWKSGTINWLASGCCQDCEVHNDDKNIKKITKEGYDSCSTRMMPIDTVLIALTGSTAGKVGLLKFESCGNQSIVGITTKKDLIIPKFLFYHLMSRRFEILSDCVGSAQPHISKEYITKTYFAVPPIEEQQRIVEQLDKLLHLCEVL